MTYTVLCYFFSQLHHILYHILFPSTAMCLSKVSGISCILNLFKSGTLSKPCFLSLMTFWKIIATGTLPFKLKFPKSLMLDSFFLHMKIHWSYHIFLSASYMKVFIGILINNLGYTISSICHYSPPQVITLHDLLNILRIIHSIWLLFNNVGCLMYVLPELLLNHFKVSFIFQL